MFEVNLETTYDNHIKFAVESLADPDLIEILNQPWVVGVVMKKVKQTSYKMLSKSE